MDKRVTTQTLANGLRLVHIPLGDDPRFYLGATIAAGARYEENNLHGAAHLLEHLMFRGSRKYPDFKSLSRAFERLGGEWNAATGYEHTEYWFSGNFCNWKPAIDLFSDFFCHPKLLDIDLEREVVKRELQREINDHGINTDLDYQSYKQIWPHSNLSKPILGDVHSIESLRKADIRSYRQKFYIPSNIVICAVGGKQDAYEEIITHLSSQFKRMPKPARLPSRRLHAIDQLPRYRGPKFKWLHHSDNEYQVQLSFLAAPAWSHTAQAASIICRILADGYFSRLRARLREELGLVYHIDAETNLFTDNGLIDITASVGIEDMTLFFKELFKIIHKLVEKGPTTEEVKLAKTRAILDLELYATDPESLSFHWAWSLLCNKNPSLDKQRRWIENISKSNLNSSIKKIFRRSRSSLLILGPNNPQIIKDCEKIFKNSAL